MKKWSGKRALGILLASAMLMANLPMGGYANAPAETVSEEKPEAKMEAPKKETGAQTEDAKAQPKTEAQTEAPKVQQETGAQTEDAKAQPKAEAQAEAPKVQRETGAQTEDAKAQPETGTQTEAAKTQQETEAQTGAAKASAGREEKSQTEAGSEAENEEKSETKAGSKAENEEKSETEAGPEAETRAATKEDAQTEEAGTEEASKKSAPRRAAVRLKTTQYEWTGENIFPLVQADAGEDEDELILVDEHGNPLENQSAVEPGRYLVTWGDASPTSFEIVKARLHISWSGEVQYAYRGSAYQISELTSAAAQRASQAAGPVPASLVVVEGSNREIKEAGSYVLIATLAEADKKYYEVFSGESVRIEITQLAVTIRTVETRKLYGEEDPELAYEIVSVGSAVGLTEEEIRKELEETEGGLLVRDAGEDVTEEGYVIRLSPEMGETNFLVARDDTLSENFFIDPLPVTITAAEDQRKYYGSKDPETYDYQIGDLPATVALTEQMLREAFGEDLLTRESGEDVDRTDAGAIPKQYLYRINPEKEFKNYALTLTEGFFAIDPLTVTILTEEMTSRDQSFAAATQELEKARIDEAIPRNLVITAKFPADEKGIEFSREIGQYIAGAEAQTGGAAGAQSSGSASGTTGTTGAQGDSGAQTGGEGEILSFGEKTELEIPIREMVYRTKKGREELSWIGRLPAGTILSVSVYGENGVVSSAPGILTVQKQPVRMSIASSAADGSYLRREDTIRLTAADDKSRGEYIRVDYNGTSYYPSLDQTITPAASDAASSHNEQTITAGFVDVLNLAFNEASFRFVYDGTAFPIPASDIHFENRGDRITIRLPEPGLVTEVTIPGARVDLSEASMGTSFEFPVSWSGKNLILTGTPITVSYTDQAGNVGKGTGSAARSAVTTPITVMMRPAPNDRGYLNGSSSVLIVSGSAATCEPIRVTVADMVQLTYSTQKEVWSDTNGTWEAAFDMSALPEGGDFQISAAYVDVNGPGAAMTARYNAYVIPPTLTSPVFRMMGYLSGMTEPGTDVRLWVGDQAYYVDVDAYGHFVLSDVPPLMAGDSFDIYVTDIAGNTAVEHFRIAQAEDSEGDMVRGTASPLGKLFFGGNQSVSYSGAATPIRRSDLENGTVSVPLLLGMSYQVGTLTIEKSGEGFTVTRQLTLGEQLGEESYRQHGERLYVYSSRPNAEQLRDHAGKEAEFGETISFDEDDIVWICGETDLSIYAEELLRLKIYNFEYLDEEARARDPEKYQEYLNYLSYQEFEG